MPLGTTIVVGLTLLAALTGIDLYLAFDKIPGNTWSEIIIMWAKATPIVPWICGVLSGHFFHPYDSMKPLFGQPNSMVVLVWTSCCVGLAGIALVQSYGFHMPPWVPFVVACVVGALLWPV
jgi:hypothetical protein